MKELKFYYNHLTWKDDLWLKDDIYIITEDGLLLTESDLNWLKENEELKIIDSFIVGVPGVDTFRLRQFCEENHPEVDFDQEFETWHSGVFQRYQEKFGYDYQEWIQDRIMSELQESLSEKGYILLVAGMLQVCALAD